MGLEIAVIWFISMVALGEEQKKTNNVLQDLSVAVEQLAEKQNADHLKITSAHAAHAARSNTIDNQHERKIEAVKDAIGGLAQKQTYLNEKIDILHP